MSRIDWIKRKQADPYQRPRIDWLATFVPFMPFWFVVAALGTTAWAIWR